MTIQTFPTLAGLGWSVIMSPIWSTKIQTAVSGREFRTANQAYPKIKWTFSYEFLRAGVQQELQTLMGFFNQMQGSFNYFYYVDPNGNYATAQQFGVGDGVTTQFPITVTNGGYACPVAISGSINTYWNGTLFNPSSINTTAPNYNVAVYSSAPSNGTILTWTGSYQYACRFNADTYDFDEFMYQLWQLKKLEIITIK